MRPIRAPQCPRVFCAQSHIVRMGSTLVNVRIYMNNIISIIFMQFSMHMSVQRQTHICKSFEIFSQYLQILCKTIFQHLCKQYLHNLSEILRNFYTFLQRKTYTRLHKFIRQSFTNNNFTKLYKILQNLTKLYNT